MTAQEKTETLKKLWNEYQENYKKFQQSFLNLWEFLPVLVGTKFHLLSSPNISVRIGEIRRMQWLYRRGTEIHLRPNVKWWQFWKRYRTNHLEDLCAAINVDKVILEDE